MKFSIRKCIKQFLPQKVTPPSSITWTKSRSSRPEVFCKKGVFENFAKVFSCELCDIFKNTFFQRAPPVAASEKLKAEAVVRRCSVKKVFLKILQRCFPVNFVTFSRIPFFKEHLRWLLLKS